MARTTARWAGLLGVARALHAANRPGGPGLGEQLSAVPRMVGASVQGRYDGLSRGRLAMIVMLLLYVILPIDFLPEGVSAGVRPRRRRRHCRCDRGLAAR